MEQENSNSQIKRAQNVPLRLWTLPHELIVELLKYFQIHELNKLSSIPLLGKMFRQCRNKTILLLFKDITNIPADMDLNSTVNKIEKIWSNQKIISLPFWGYKTDGGVLYNSIPFWVGKAFLKTDKPIVGLSAMHSGCFSGCISQDYYEFSNIVAGLSRILRAVSQNDAFRQDIHEIDLKDVIMHSFHTDLDGATVEQRDKFDEFRDKLYTYAGRLGRFLGQQDELAMENLDIIRLPLMANLHSIEISRKFKFQVFTSIKNCVQTLIIGVKQQLPFKTLEKLTVPEIACTNLTKQQEQIFTFGFKPNITPHSEAKFIIFKPNQYGILLWLDFGRTKLWKKTIPFEARVWTNEVHVCMVRGFKEREPYGLTISYIDFKGIMI